MNGTRQEEVEESKVSLFFSMLLYLLLLTNNRDRDYIVTINGFLAKKPQLPKITVLAPNLGTFRVFSRGIKKERGPNRGGE